MDASLVPEGNPRLSPTRFVKVFLHGEPFGRKINLSAHNSYDSLSFTLKRLGNNYSLTQYQLSGLAMNEEEGVIDDDFMFLYDSVEGYRFFLGEVPWEDFTVSVKKIYILPGEKQDDNEEYLEEGDGDNDDGNAAGADGDDDANCEDGALDAAVAEDDGDGAEDEGDEAVAEDGDGAYDDEDEAVGDDGDDASVEGNDGGAAE